MTRDVREYIAACTTCARSKTSHSPPSGLLHPLPTPSRPWSHIALPTATETADILVHHVFRHHGIPSDIVSDRGPQFCSQVWKAFCSALGATGCLPSKPPSGSHHHCFRLTNWTWQCPQYRNISSAVNASGNKPGQLSSGQRKATARRPTVTGWWGPVINPDRGYGCHPGTSPSRPRHANLLPGTSVHILSTKSLIPPVSVFTSQPLSRSTRPSTSPRSSRSLTAVYARLPLPRHPPGSSMALRRTPLAASWTSGAGVAAISSWSIGRGMVLRNAPGSPVRSFWTPPLSPTSTVPTRIVVLDRLEAVVRGGGTVMAPLSSPPLCSAPDSTSCDQFTLINSALLKETQLHNSSPDRYPLWIPARQCHLCGSQFEPPCCSGNTTLC
ncbi:uncharacterized protein LOC110013547 isoform X2 [Oryzias latipes]|uniref:uncharacterized protein LOC110013547 isoform X2 n=1 Tax=Oryzias latipes TaxID=8090 RepID=UPI000CE19568|nr:uncharacterized protein LOC110013547 isoform X2 [Oryzias latipes]